MRRKLLLVALIILALINLGQTYQRVIIYQLDLSQWYETGSMTSDISLTVTHAAESGKTFVLKGFIVGGTQQGHGDLYFGDTKIMILRFSANRTIGANIVLEAPENTLIKVVLTLDTTGNGEIFLYGTRR